MSTNGYTEFATGKGLFRIGEVSRLTDTKPFVLRYWETEFPMLQPVKSPKGHRLYRREDVETVRHIKRLLYDEGFTIAGARRHLREASEGRHESSGSQQRPTHQAAAQQVATHAAAGFSAPRSSHHVPELDQTRPIETHYGDVNRGMAAGEKVEVSPNVHEKFIGRNEAPAPSPINRKLLLELRDSLRAFLTLLESE